jgi:methionyl-tRNA formyltransferase
MNLALIMNFNSYAGREYLNLIGKANIQIEVICIGNFSEINQEEEIRCGGLWTPPSIESLENLYKFKINKFETLKSVNLVDFLKKKKFDLCIQGGTGILKKEVINQFSIGVVNFHPGDLPLYRGCSAPEWQIFENKPVYSTCHFIDEGIDTGDILMKKILHTHNETYESFRASIYPATAVFVVEVLKSILLDTSLIHRRIKQDNSIAIYRNYIGEKNIIHLKNNFFKQV